MRCWWPIYTYIITYRFRYHVLREKGNIFNWPNDKWGKPSVGKDKTVNENKKKGDKLVLEDVTEEKTEKKK